jgi:tRNA modification GTPase
MNDTIAAISTAPGEGAIGIVRLSGNRAREILGKLIGRLPESFEDRKLYYGTVKEPSSNLVIDEVLAVYMKSPRTYTREDVAEIYCHGSHISVRKILEAALACGAVLAERGEFTKRAFLNGRIDLAQADAVIDVIKAGTDFAHGAALNRLEGKLSNRIREIRSSLADAIAEAVVNLDYPDEAGDPLHDDSANMRIADIASDAVMQIRELIDTADTGRMIREGVSAVICGKPNVGKSSLLNALLRELRAIVSEIPGTTRDRIDEYANVQGIPVKFTDTAGIRNAEGEIEQVGIDIATEAIRLADIILFVIDGSESLDENDKRAWENVSGKTVILLVSKSDKSQAVDFLEVKKFSPDSRVIKISSVTGEGIHELENEIANLIFGDKTISRESLLVTDIRQKNLLIRAEEETQKGIDSLRAGEPLDFSETDLRAARDSLGEIIGETVTEDILDRVFERFCVGK